MTTDHRRPDDVLARMDDALAKMAEAIEDLRAVVVDIRDQGEGDEPGTG